MDDPNKNVFKKTINMLTFLLRSCLREYCESLLGVGLYNNYNNNSNNA